MHRQMSTKNFYHRLMYKTRLSFHLLSVTGKGKPGFEAEKRNRRDHNGFYISFTFSCN